MSAHVAFDAVSVRFGSRHAIREVSAEIGQGRFAALVGPNGSGKSTLLSLLTGYHPRYTGAVRVRGKEIARLSGAARAAQIGVLRQDAGPLPDVTVAELVALGTRRLPDADVARALISVGLSDCTDQPVPTLSGGQRQRALLARAIRHRPQLLVLDEPTNHLDVHHQFAILELVRAMGITVVCALHDLNLAHRYADEVLVLAEGRLHAFGPPQQVIDGELMSQVFRVRGEPVTAGDGARHIVLGPEGATVPPAGSSGAP